MENNQLPTRWEIELEFVQSLANIQYLHHLAQNKHLEDPKFLNYLEYLNYWRKPEYAKYLVYPNCLHVLSLLQNEDFRKNILSPDFMSTVMNDMVKRWQDNDSIIDRDEEKKGSNDVKPETGTEKINGVIQNGISN